jgi:ankyrin repeat protein
MVTPGILIKFILMKLVLVLLVLCAVFASRTVHKSVRSSERFKFKREVEAEISPLMRRRSPRSRPKISPLSVAVVNSSFIGSKNKKMPDLAISDNLSVDLNSFDLLNEEEELDIAPVDVLDEGKIVMSPSDNFAWECDREAEWSLSDLEFRQFLFCLGSANPIFIKFIDSPVSGNVEQVINNRCFKFNMTWPNSDRTNVPNNEMACKFFSLAFKMLAIAKYASFEVFIRARLVELERPIYDCKSGRYFGLLGIAIDNFPKVGIDKIDLLLKYSPEYMMNVPNSVGLLPLHAAVMKNNLDLVKRVVEAGADCNLSPNNRIFTPFMTAVTSQHKEIVEFFLQRNLVDPNIVLEDGTNALMLLATNFDDAHVLKLLQGSAIKLNCAVCYNILKQILNQSEDMYTVFTRVLSLIVDNRLKFLYPSILYLARLAVVKNNLKFVRFLHAAKVPLNVSPGVAEAFPGDRLIHFAASSGLTEMVNLLIDLGSDIDSLNRDGFSPLSIAFATGYVELVCSLITRGAKVYLESCIDSAIYSGNLQIIAALLSTYKDLDNFYLPGGFNLITRTIHFDRAVLLDFILKSDCVNVFSPDLEGRTIFNTKTSNTISTLEIVKYYKHILKRIRS